MHHCFLEKIKSVINMGTKIHNNLPFKIKCIENVKVFKNKLKVIYYQNCFCSLQESFSNNDSIAFGLYNVLHIAMFVVLEMYSLAVFN
jgi:hypothetical protein